MVSYERSVECSVLIYARYIARILRGISPSKARIKVREIGDPQQIKSEPIKTPDDVTTFKLVRKTVEKIPTAEVSVCVRFGWLSGYNVDLRHSKPDSTTLLVELFPASLFADVWAIAVLSIGALIFVFHAIVSFEWTQLLPGPLRAFEDIPRAVFWAVVYLVGALLVLPAGDVLRKWLEQFGDATFDDKRLENIARLLSKETDENPPRMDDPELNPVEAIRRALSELHAPKGGRDRSSEHRDAG